MLPITRLSLVNRLIYFDMGIAKTKINVKKLLKEEKLIFSKTIEKTIKTDTNIFQYNGQSSGGFIRGYFEDINIKKNYITIRYNEKRVCCKYDRYDLNLMNKIKEIINSSISMKQTECTLTGTYKYINGDIKYITIKDAWVGFYVPDYKAIIKSLPNYEELRNEMLKLENKDSVEMIKDYRKSLLSQ